VLFAHPIGGAPRPCVDEGDEIPQEAVLASVCERQGIGQKDDTPPEVPAPRRPRARAFGNGLRDIHHDPDAGVLLEQLASNLAGLHEGTSHNPLRAIGRPRAGVLGLSRVKGRRISRLFTVTAPDRSASERLDDIPAHVESISP